jgi:hypothetical protein
MKEAAAGEESWLKTTEGDGSGGGKLLLEEVARGLMHQEGLRRDLL